MDADRTRAGQYSLTLKRDTVADLLKYPQSLKAQIRKGIITDAESPYLCNRETDILVNEIKSPKEIYLKDATRVPWLVLYLKKGVLGNNDSSNVVSIPASFASEDMSISTSIEQWPLYQYVGTNQGIDALIGESFRFVCCYEDYYVQDNNVNNRRSYYYEVDREGRYVTSKISQQDMIGDLMRTNLVLTNAGNTQKVSLDSSFSSRAANMKTQAIGSYGLLSVSDTNAMLAFSGSGKIVKDSNNKYFQVTLVKVKTETQRKHVGNVEQATLFNYFTSGWNSGTAQSASPNNNAFGVKMTVGHYRLAIEEVQPGGATLDLGACQLKTEDSPLFDAIAVPYGDMHYTNPSEYLYGWDTNKTRSMQIMNAIATQLTSSKAFDLQILPYCPVVIPENSSTIDANAYMLSEGTMFLRNSNNVGLSVVEQLQGGGVKYEDFVFVATSANITFDIEQEINSSDYKFANSIDDTCKKIKYINDCTKLRLCSPNYNGLFEFNLAKNGMEVDRFNVDMTLRPYNPYIHVNPNFNKLYGADTDDCRGLICQGDFSLGTLDSAWAQYELQNRNYQAIFDRQVQNLELTQEVQMMNAAFQAAGGTVTGAAAGAAMGAKAGPYGAIAGAAVGGVLGAAGGIADVYNTDRLQKEQKSYMKDNYSLQLGNVRALPNSITKTSALTANNKFWPFIELYECTEQEKEAYINKITYDGMSVGIIDTLNNWVTFDKNIDKLQYLQCRLIRNPNAIAIENHELDDLNNELMKGIYI